MWMRVTISGLESREYEHPFDRRALAALEKTPGLGCCLTQVPSILDGQATKSPVYR